MPKTLGITQYNIKFFYKGQRKCKQHEKNPQKYFLFTFKQCNLPKTYQDIIFISNFRYQNVIFSEKYDQRKHIIPLYKQGHFKLIQIVSLKLRCVLKIFKRISLKKAKTKSKKVKFYFGIEFYEHKRQKLDNIKGQAN